MMSCARIYTAHGVYHRVRPGESLNSIASSYGSSLQDVAEINNIEDPSKIKVGQRIYIPQSKQKKHKRSKKHKGPKPSSESEDIASSKEGEIEFDRQRFQWPLKGPVSSNFGMRQSSRHDGIDIRAKKGTPIHAADSGHVVFSGRLSGYGNMILIKHEGDFFTAYAHNSKNLTRKGKHVKRGEVIAQVGSTGRATGPHLHFEVRKGSKARNPLFFLPKR
ncbi:MAG: hypothetical protein A3I75_02110 [Deltaproteobacteria bacterium RIFCSPLOWO2_02_FULL_50_16]|nr:MAG: hypothetical protein A2053_03965 [Deltaproteobacteria bacterium GWA2_50_8]OGQ25735.1 MAG: hypothetical protein A3B79_07275 [Deltaproteobacteria bacterium RIFCSPHIGHO2_02_FULL_50_15]OGQ57027.1 MAG: hypothetical protein A3I75_02110 [Deltaproteobacteria bacterium RIFCSPLOWO2_02_FULL_50_16]OGQ68077.1 MAG: hypothetical protein A3F89_05805 [Deltaproteobacteria bacterium RIFCSPLOWO2_12_FULL_50_11]